MIRTSRIARRVLALALAVVLLALPAMPALAEDVPTPPAPTVVAGVTVCGVSVGGMTAEEASAAVLVGWSLPALAPIMLNASGKIFTFDPTPAVALDLSGLIADALAATAPADLAPRFAIDTARVSSFVASADTSYTIKPVSSKRTVVNRRLKITKPVYGRRLDRAATVATLTVAINAELAAGGAQQAPVVAKTVVLTPTYTPSNIGKTILVVLGERYLRLYNGTTVVKKYRCAIGMPGHVTPRGTFKVIAKNPHPAWRNPGSAWARSMPSYIAPGYYNPLGLRALYINSPGIRIHGTSKTWSMGRAASHGCVRLTNANIVKLYPLVPVGTPVLIVK